MNYITLTPDLVSFIYEKDGKDGARNKWSKFMKLLILFSANSSLINIWVR